MNMCPAAMDINMSRFFFFDLWEDLGEICSIDFFFFFFFLFLQKKKKKKKKMQFLQYFFLCRKTSKVAKKSLLSLKIRRGN